VTTWTAFWFVSFSSFRSFSRRKKQPKLSNQHFSLFSISFFFFFFRVQNEGFDDTFGYVDG
jgi:hypothetical protein